MNIAILTIHKITNYGSALQTYALQRFLEQNFSNSECTILDYKFPNSFHLKERYKRMGLLKKYRYKLHRIKNSLSPITIARKHKFQQFWNEYFHLSHTFKSQKSILGMNTKDFDIFLLGSDQVWNTKTLCGDKAFLFAFLSDTDKCFSYASSFGISQLSKDFVPLFKKELSKFRSIGVREEKAMEILSSLGFKDNSRLVCDPTLLLNANEYDSIANESKYKIDEDYILVYCLEYAFCPYPAIRDVVNELQRKYRYKVIFIDNKVKGVNQNYQVLSSIGPCEFTYLFRNAKIVVTSSFHGTAFSVINRKPFLSIAPREGDSRIGDFLNHLGLNGNMVYNDQNQFDYHDNPYTSDVETKLSAYINASRDFLISNIKVLSNE